VHCGGLKATEVSHRRSPFPIEGQRTAKGARTEVRGTDDMAEWTRVLSRFVGHRNICKPQMTIMTP
jgi:hypothetical protein